MCIRDRNDIVSYESAVHRVRIDLNKDANGYQTAQYSDPNTSDFHNGDSIKDFEAVLGSNYNDILISGSEDAQLEGGRGDDVFKDTDTSNGRNVYVFGASHGKDVVEDFKAGASGDVLSFQRSVNGKVDFSDVLQYVKQVGSDVVIDTGLEEQITLKNTNVSNLTADNFSWDNSKLIQNSAGLAV